MAPRSRGRPARYIRLLNKSVLFPVLDALDYELAVVPAAMPTLKEPGSRSNEYGLSSNGHAQKINLLLFSIYSLGI